MESILFVLFVILSVADGIITYKILQGGGRELNPVVRWLNSIFGDKGGLFVSKLLSTTLVGSSLATTTLGQLKFAVLLYAGVYIWNFIQYKKQQG